MAAGGKPEEKREYSEKDYRDSREGLRANDICPTEEVVSPKKKSRLAKKPRTISPVQASS